LTKDPTPIFDMPEKLLEDAAFVCFHTISRFSVMKETKI
jgi:hypothetical protein